MVTVVISGYVADLSCREFPDGKFVCNIRMVEKQWWKKIAEEGFKHETVFVRYNVAVWGKRGRDCEKHLVLGSHVTVTSTSLIPDVYTRTDGGKAVDIMLTAQAIEFGPVKQERK